MSLSIPPLKLAKGADPKTTSGKSSKTELIKEYSGKNFSGFKEDLSESLVELISPIKSEISRLMGDKIYLDSIIKKGSEKANDRAVKTLKEVYDIIGFIKK